MLQAVSDRKIRQIAAQAVRPSPRQFIVGEKVYYKRPNKSGRGDKWRGPARVLGEHTEQHWYLLDHGGFAIRASEWHLKGVNEIRVGMDGSKKVFFDDVEEKERQQIQNLDVVEEAERDADQTAMSDAADSKNTVKFLSFQSGSFVKQGYLNNTIKINSN